MPLHGSHKRHYLRLAAAALVLVSPFLNGCGRVGTAVNGDPAPLAVAIEVLPAAQAGTPYSATLQASGGTAPYTWSLIGGALPQGLLLNTSSGTISGTPIITATGTVSLTFSATDSGSPAQTITATVALTITPATLRVSTTSLPSGTAGVPYSATLSAAGGVGPYTWTLVSGTLPAGLTLNASTGAISGNPAPASGTQLVFQVRDSESPAQTSTVMVAINITLTGGGLSITTTALPGGQVGVAYMTQLSASGGTAPYTWALTLGALPAGLSLNTVTGAISGTPTAAAAAVSLTFKVTDSGGFTQSNVGTFSLSIAPATLRTTSASLPSGQVGVAYTATLAASGGTTPYTWRVTAGGLPAGLVLNAATGAISGTPSTAVSAASLTFKVTDAGAPAQAASVTLMLTITPATLRITSASLPSGQVGVAYAATLAASGGTVPYQWTLAGGTLPAGLALNGATGAISGTPSTAVSGASLTFKVTDVGVPAQSASVTLMLTITPATLRVTSSSLPNGQVGVAYTATLAASGGTLPYQWALASGTLPAGLALNGATGAISGTPSTAVSGASLTFKVTDASVPAQTTTATLQLTIASATLRVTSTSLPSGQVGVAYAATLTASGGTSAYAWTLTAGTLPAGLSLNGATGSISGTPIAAVSAASLTFKVTDASVPTQSASVTLMLTITPATLRVTTGSLPNGQVGVAYTATLAASGGTLPYQWTLASGTLPAGLALNAASGAISGTPTVVVSGTSLTFKVTDANVPAQSATVTLQLTIATATLRITSTSLPSGQVGVAYTATLAASGGTTPYTWSLTAGSLPAGLALNAATGAISGTPTAAVSSASLTFKVTDAGVTAQTASVTLMLAITPATLRITSASLPSGQVGVVYIATLMASGGTFPYTWTLTAGTLPAGLALNAASGAISGTPTTAVSGAALTFKVTDSGNPAQSVSATLTLTISSPTLTITTTSLPNGQVGIGYSATLSAAGGTNPYTWTLAAGTLPAGLMLNATTGAISGTPTAAVSGASLTFKISDTGNPAQSAIAALTLTITPATLRLTTSSLPNGQVGVVYIATLTASGGTSPYTWTLTAGTLPAGLSLNGATGAISGTPTAAVSGAALTFKVTDSGNPAQSASAPLTLTISTATLTITTTSLPNGQVGVSYSAMLSAAGGTSPYTWTLAAGALPAGLSLSAAGLVSGVPTTAVTATPLTVQVTDSGSPSQSRTANLTLTISASVITVSAISPKTAALAITQTLKVSATTNDAAGVKWTLTPVGGSISPATSLSGVSVTLTAPGSAGVYTLTATSVTDASKSFSITVAVTDLAGVFTYHNDLARDGANTQEYALTRANVNSTTFGKLFSCQVDGAVYGQPLWVANLTVSGVKRNVLFTATQHDSLYAFDADTGAPLWKVSLIDAAHGAASGETSVPAGPSGNLVGSGYGDITPEVGITSTPVIDPAAGILYVVSKSVNSSGTTFYQRLHAINYITGNEESGSPVVIAGTYPGTGDKGTTDTFSPRQQNQRAGLALVNGVIYIAWSSHEDTSPWYGWVMAYQYSGSFTRTAVLNVTPNARQGGIWMGGGAPAADGAGHLYLITGNGVFDANSATAPNNDYGDSFLQLTAGLTVSSYFAPSDELNDYETDDDFGSGGSAVVLNLPSGSPQHLVIGGGKDGALYLLNGDSMGGLGDAHARQCFLNLTGDVPCGGGATGASIFATGAFWNSTFYIAGVNGPLNAFVFNSSNLFNTSPASQSPSTFGFPGSTPSVSATPAADNGIVWALDNAQYCTRQSPGCGPAVLHAYNAANLATELWNSALVGSDRAGNAVKFTVPTVANGKVYIGTRGNNTGGVYGSGGVYGEVDVYGLKP